MRGLLECIEKAVRQIGIQGNLLQQAEREVGKEMPGLRREAAGGG